MRGYGGKEITRKGRVEDLLVERIPIMRLLLLGLLLNIWWKLILLGLLLDIWREVGLLGLLLHCGRKLVLLLLLHVVGGVLHHIVDIRRDVNFLIRVLRVLKANAGEGIIPRTHHRKGSLLLRLWLWCL